MIEIEDVQEWLSVSGIEYGPSLPPDLEMVDWQFKAHFPSKDEPCVLASVEGGQELRVNRSLGIAEEHLDYLRNLPRERYEELVFNLRRDLILIGVLFGFPRDNKGILKAVAISVRVCRENVNRPSLISAMQKAYDSIILTRTRIQRLAGNYGGQEE